jgi:hypothetical protein
MNIQVKKSRGGVLLTLQDGRLTTIDGKEVEIINYLSKTEIIKAVCDKFSEDEIEDLIYVLCDNGFSEIVDQALTNSITNDKDKDWCIDTTCRYRSLCETCIDNCCECSKDCLKEGKKK